MVNQADVTSGFDVEFLMGEEFVRHFLLCSMETGSIPWFSESSGTNADGTPFRTATIVHPPAELEQKRLYPVHPDFAGQEHPFQDIVGTVYSDKLDEFQVVFLPEDPLTNPLGADLTLRLFPSVIDLLPTPPIRLIENLLSVDLHLRFDVAFDVRPNGLLGNVGVQLELLDITGPLIDAAVGLKLSKATILADMKRQIDRRVPFGVAGGGALQAIATRQFTGDPARPNAIGVYLNLALQSGEAPDSLHPARGDVTLAKNFLEPGARMAFAFPASTYKKLGDDFKFKMAVPKPDAPGEFHYPLMDGDKQVGIIKGISVEPEMRQAGGIGQPLTPTNVLVIDIHGEYAVDDFFDPDFHLRIRLVPKVEAQGVFDFDIDFDLSLSPLAKIVTLFLGMALTVVLPKLGLSLLVLSILIFKIVEKVGASAAQSAIQGELDRTSFLDTLPHKLIVESRRWDPLYSTLHRVETADVQVAINLAGFAFDARDSFIGRKFVPLANMVIRSETRNAEGAVDGLVYRANDIGRFVANDLKNVFPATDRMAHGGLLLPQGDVEAHRVLLSLEQVAERMAAKDRHVRSLDYVPKKIHSVRNTIAQIMSISKTELPEIEALARNRLRNEISSTRGAELRAQAIEELTAELGRAPTDDEIGERFDVLLAAAVKPLVPGRTRIEVDARARFDLAPHEFAALQKLDILVLGRNHLEIRRRTRDGKTTVFYRDYERPFEPNTPKHDNLRALPKYVPQPP
jgi:hypothetical protein